MLRTNLGPLEELRAAQAAGGLLDAISLGGCPLRVVTAFDQAQDILADSTRFSSRAPTRFLGGDAGEDRDAYAGNLLLMDPPEHGRLRRLCAEDFTPRRVRDLEPCVTTIVNEQLDATESQGTPFDLITEFARPIPSLVICELLGVPAADRVEFQEVALRRIDVSLPQQARSRAAQEAVTYMKKLVARARIESSGGLVGRLVREHSRAITDAELVGLVNLLLIAGHQTTTDMMGLSVLTLTRRPELADRLRGDQSLVARAVEELLRIHSTVSVSTPRRVAEVTHLGGQRLDIGEIVAVSLCTANRDPQRFADADTLNLDEPTRHHLAFGHGPHHCLGATLARLELTVALPALLRRFPRLAPIEQSLEISPPGPFFGLSSLMMRR